VRYAPQYRVKAGDIETLKLRALHDTGRGAIIATFGQEVDGGEVYRGEVKVLMQRNLDLIAISGAPTRVASRTPNFALLPAHAVAEALGAHLGISVETRALREAGATEGGYVRVELVSPVSLHGIKVSLERPARTKRVLFKDGFLLRPAHFVEFFILREGSRSQEAFRYVIADPSGDVLERRNLVRDAYRYRVFVDPTGRPLDGPQSDFSPHPTGMPDGSEPSFVEPLLIEADGFNTNPSGGSDPWLPDGATETRGNNVDAYADLASPDGFSTGDVRAHVSSENAFDWTYDTLQPPKASESQTMASVTQLFYVINWLHDWYYDSGFDEASGNAQYSNYGRGGLQGDRLLAEAQDYSDINNSNMGTPADGDSPKMQILLWSGPDERSLHVEPLGKDLRTGAAGFGPTEFDLEGNLILGDDGASPVTDACQAISNAIAGLVALVDRGNCTFKQKAVNVQAAGAIGMVLANNQGTGPVDMPDADPPTEVTIPVLSISKEDGDSLKAALENGTVSVRLFRRAGVDRDGALENTVVAHEWAHYLFARLTDCMQPICFALTEGISDFAALHMMVREGDNLDGTYAMAVYATRFMANPYFGIRRAPYSVDFTKNAFTFRHISDGEPLPTTTPLMPSLGPNSESHNAGEIWAEMLFEAYVALLKASKEPSATRSFDETRRAMSDYLVAGLKAMPQDATLLETRDALLLTAGAASPEDQLAMAQAFARRGAGTCAESPPRDSSDFVGVVESYEVKPKVVVGEATLDDSILSCDGNGRLDAGEQGVLRVSLVNASFVPFEGGTLAVTAGGEGFAFPHGSRIEVGPLAPFTSTTVALPLSLDIGKDAMQVVPFTVEVAAEATCENTRTRTTFVRTNYQEIPQATALDDVEASTTTWSPGGDYGDTVWARTDAGGGNHVWHGHDFAALSDTWLLSPTVRVSDTGNFVVAFRHRHTFEAGEWEGQTVYYDAAVVEVTDDGGMTWQDVSAFADPKYGGLVTDLSGNTLAGRLAYVAKNESWPEFDEVTLDFGAPFAGKEVRLRFRIGTDQAAGAYGWDIDDIRFYGIEGTPFTLVAHRPTACVASQEDAGTLDAGSSGSDASDTPPPPLTTCGGCSTSTRAGSLLAVLTLVAALSFRRRNRL